MPVKIRKIKIPEIVPISTSHACGKKRVMLTKEDTATNLTQIALTRLKSGEGSGWHVHPTMEEMFIVRKGILRIETVDGIITGEAGDFIRLPAGISHNVKAVTDVEMLTIGCAIERNS